MIDGWVGQDETRLRAWPDGTAWHGMVKRQGRIERSAVVGSGVPGSGYSSIPLGDLIRHSQRVLIQA
jgi:hypothetical protein